MVELVQTHDVPPINVFISPVKVFRGMVKDTVSVSLLEDEITLEREAKEVYLIDLIRLEALYQKLDEDFIEVSTLLSFEQEKTVKLKGQIFDAIYISFSVGAVVSALVFIAVGG